ncbi:MAG: hypothetical protein ABIK49_03550 [candidate division WOR-3 bacterium]
MPRGGKDFSKSPLFYGVAQAEKISNFYNETAGNGNEGRDRDSPEGSL